MPMPGLRFRLRRREMAGFNIRLGVGLGGRLGVGRGHWRQGGRRGRELSVLRVDAGGTSSGLRTSHRSQDRGWLSILTLLPFSLDG